MKYRKKPVTVEARRVTHETAHEVAAWCKGAPGWGKAAAPSEKIDTPDAFLGVSIFTLEGTMLASPGDWIIRGVQGEFYPCKPDIFDATYEPVTDDHVCDTGDFDRTICGCGSMHVYCDTCGDRQDECEVGR